MLDDALTTEERRALLLLLVSVALSDGRLSESEVRFVQRRALPIRAQVGDLLAEVDSVPTDGLVRILSARPSTARIAVIELLRLAHVDEVYSHVEKAEIASLARRLGVAPASLQAMEDWALHEWEHLALGRRLVESG